MKVLILAFLMALSEEDQFELINDHAEVKKLQEQGYEIVKVSDPVITRAGHQQKLFVTVSMDKPEAATAKVAKSPGRPKSSTTKSTSTKSTTAKKTTDNKKD